MDGFLEISDSFQQIIQSDRSMGTTEIVASGHVVAKGPGSPLRLVAHI